MVAWRLWSLRHWQQILTCIQLLGLIVWRFQGDVCKSGHFPVNLRQKSSLMRSSCHWQGSSPFGLKIPKMSEGLSYRCPAWIWDVFHFPFSTSCIDFLTKVLSLQLLRPKDVLQDSWMGQIVSNGDHTVYTNLHDPALCQSQRLYTLSYMYSYDYV